MTLQTNWKGCSAVAPLFWVQNFSRVPILSIPTYSFSSAACTRPRLVYGHTPPWPSARLLTLLKNTLRSLKISLSLFIFLLILLISVHNSSLWLETGLPINYSNSPRSPFAHHNFKMNVSLMLFNAWLINSYIAFIPLENQRASSLMALLNFQLFNHCISFNSTDSCLN